MPCFGSLIEIMSVRATKSLLHIQFCRSHISTHVTVIVKCPLSLPSRYLGRILVPIHHSSVIFIYFNLSFFPLWRSLTISFQVSKFQNQVFEAMTTKHIRSQPVITSYLLSIWNMTSEIDLTVMREHFMYPKKNTEQLFSIKSRDENFFISPKLCTKIFVKQNTKYLSCKKRQIVSQIGMAPGDSNTTGFSLSSKNTGSP